MNILTFDIEEWFHLLDNASTRSEKEWSNYESRIHRNMDKIFSILEKSNYQATFFIVGWIAKKYPEIVKKIDSFGYEIGSHTNMHQLMYEQKREEVQDDLKRSIDILQSITGKKVISFRAPGFSITECNSWVFEILANNGITHDCSIFPAGRAHGGYPSFNKSIPTKLDVMGYIIKEFPINTFSVLGKKFIFSGGGYFRVSPYLLTKYMTKKSKYVMTYFHPRDFDPNQPIINELNFLRKFKSYAGLKTCFSKLERWVTDFDFVDLRTADLLIDWEKTPIIKI